MRVSLLAGLVLLAGASAVPALRSTPAPAPLAAVSPRAAPASGAPTVTITPAGGAFSGSTPTLQLDVKIEWCDDTALNASSRIIVLDGSIDVKPGFSYTTGTKAGCGAYAVSRDTLSLVATLPRNSHQFT